MKLYFLLLLSALTTVSGSQCDASDGRCDDPRLAYSLLHEANPEVPSGVDVGAIVDELRSGKDGYVVVSGLFSKEEVAAARDTVLHIVSTQGKKATHFQGNEESSDGERQLSARVWNLLNKGKIFERVMNHSIFTEVPASKG